MRYAILFFGQGVNFLIAVINMRAIASGRWAITAASDFVFCLVSYTLIQRIAHAGSTFELLAYAAGGTTGSLAAMWVTRHWRQQ
jgi:hypothetical protein